MLLEVPSEQSLTHEGARTGHCAGRWGLCSLSCHLNHFYSSPHAVGYQMDLKYWPIYKHGAKAFCIH